MRFRFLVLGIFFILIQFSVVHAEYISASFHDPHIEISFNKPKGTVPTFDETRTITIYHENTSGSITGLSATITGITGMTVSLDKTDIGISGSGEKDVTVTFKASSSMAEGTYSGSLKFNSSDGRISKNWIITVEIHHPNPTIRARWDESNWGPIKAGSNFERILTVEEYMGYKNASNVSVFIAEVGPAEISYSKDLGFIGALGFKNVHVNVTIPEHDLRPGEYNLKPIITSTSVITPEPQEAIYEIPVPQLVIEEDSLDLGKITFEPGKDKGAKELTVREAGGFTPIEGITITLTSGEEGWITYPEDDYIPPGESKNYTFVVTLPPDASLGQKEWEFRFDTKYAGSKGIYAWVTVYFPGIEEAIDYLKNLSEVAESDQERSLIQDTILLLESSKGKTEIRKIAMVMSVYSGTRSLLSDLKEVEASRRGGEFISGGDAIIRANSALNKIKIGDENLKDAELKLYSSKSATSAKKLWSLAAGEILSALEGQVEASRDSNYKLTALCYKRMSRIYSLLGDSEKSKEYAGNQEEMEELYRQTLTSASDSKLEAGEELKEARGNMFKLGEGEEAMYFVLNPFAYDTVSGNYKSAIEKYITAEGLYRRAGEVKDADLLRENLETLIKQKKQIQIAFIAYGSLLALLFLWIVARVSLGLQRFRKDDEDGRLGVVVMGKEAGA